MNDEAAIELGKLCEERRKLRDEMSKADCERAELRDKIAHLEARIAARYLELRDGL